MLCALVLTSWFRLHRKPWLQSEVGVARILPLTGTVASWGIRNDRGIRYVFDIINAQGGVKSLGGAKIKYAVSDTESKPEVAQSQTEKIVSGDVSSIFGCNQSPATLVVSQVTERKKVALICVSDFDPLITERGFQYMFRTTPIMKDLAKTCPRVCSSHEQSKQDKL